MKQKLFAIVASNMYSITAFALPLIISIIIIIILYVLFALALTRRTRNTQ